VKNTAQDKCCLTTPSFLSMGTRGKPSEKAAPPAVFFTPSDLNVVIMYEGSLE